MSHKNQPPPDELSDTTQFLENLRLRAMATFLGTLMLLYSFFGSIYRVPTQMEQQGKEIVTLQAMSDKTLTRVNELEKFLATKEDAFAEVARSRQRIETLEKIEAGRVSMQQQIDRLDSTSKELAKLLDNTSLRLSELNVTVTALKETVAETRRTLEDLKRK